MYIIYVYMYTYIYVYILAYDTHLAEGNDDGAWQRRVR